MVFRNSTWSGLIGKGTDIKKTGVYDIIASQLTPDAIYDFSSVTFTPGGASNSIGPTLAQVISGITGNNNWKNNSDYLSTRGTQGGIIRWLVPADATYRIITIGASGGTGSYTSYNPGYGAIVQGDFSLLKNTMLNIVVGQRGQNDFNNWGGGGGGGSFVWVENASLPLIVAGGGGGGGIATGTGSGNGGYGLNGGGNGGNGGAQGGTNGYPGGYNSYVCGGGNGQGWYGGSTYSCGGNFTWPSLYNNPTGLSTYTGGPAGGFGGGAFSYGGAGGGGGFSGGGSGGWYPAGQGGGGGNYNTGTNQSSSVNTANGFVNGSVQITRI